MIGVETLSRVTDYTDRNTCVLFGDGAGAVVLKSCPPGEGVLSIVMQSDGNLGDVLEIPAGISKNRMTAERVGAGDGFIRMKGKELFKIAVRSMADSLTQALEQSGLAASDLELLIPHQANLRIIDAVRERLDFPAERVLVNIQKYGNTSSASIPISLHEAVSDGRVQKGDHVGFTAFGGGVTWGSAVMKWTQPAPVARPRAAAHLEGARA